MRRKGKNDWGWVPVPLPVVKKRSGVVFDDKTTEAIKDLEKALTAGGWPTKKPGEKLELIDPELLLEMKRVTYKPEHIKLWKAKHGKKDKNDS